MTLFAWLSLLNQEKITVKQNDFVTSGYIAVAQFTLDFFKKCCIITVVVLQLHWALIELETVHKLRY